MEFNLGAHVRMVGGVRMCAWIAVDAKVGRFVHVFVVAQRTCARAHGEHAMQFTQAPGYRTHVKNARYREVSGHIFCCMNVLGAEVYEHTRDSMIGHSCNI